MFVSVVICTWNRAKLLQQTLESFRHLTIPDGVQWELLVVDNNSSDETPKTIADASQHLPIVHLTEPRAGQSFARNLAFSQSQGEFILFTDDDVLVDPNWMTAMLLAFEQFRADLVYGRSLPRWETEPPKWYSMLFMGKFALLDHGDTPHLITDQMQTGYGLNHAFRRSALEQLGGYRTDMGLRHQKGAGGEDSEMFHRAHRTGLRVVYTPHSFVRHFIPAERCQKSFARVRVWRGSEDYLNLLDETIVNVPKIFGIPRYVYRLQLGNGWRYLSSLIRRRHDEAFFYELRLLQFTGLLYRAWERRKSPQKAK